MQKSITKKIQIESGGANQTLNFTLEIGRVTNVVALSNGAEAEDNSTLSLAFRNSDGVDILSQMNVKLWGMRQGASFKDSMIPLDLDTKGRMYQLFLATTRVPRNFNVNPPDYAQKHEVEVTFFYE